MPSIPDTSVLLSRVPPDLQARVSGYWQTWENNCLQHNLNADLGVTLDMLGYVWACSEFVAVNMSCHPQAWQEVVAQGSLLKSQTLSDFQVILHKKISAIQPLQDNVLMSVLRQFRQQQMLAIAWRDLADIANTSETLASLTDLAEVCVDTTLEYLYQDQCELLGTPVDSAGKLQRMIVLGMGKLGGGELNFSSDIDLIFGFAEEGETQGARVMDNGDFFVRLGQRLIRILNEITADGFVFRVDMLLRPHGADGPLAMSMDGMEQYYQTQGRDWERYAMIKARVIGGDRAAGSALLTMLKPFVYRRYLDYGAFESIRNMKTLLDADVKRKGNLDNIKLGLGGIREIEFIGQTFQLIRGGSEIDLQIRSIISVLIMLAQKAIITRQTADDLLLSYDFLRRLENRLQMYADAQIHVLPLDDLHRQSIALAMHCDNWDQLVAETGRQRQLVHDYFNKTVALPQFAETDVTTDVFDRIWSGAIVTDEAVQLLQAQGLAAAENILQQVATFREQALVKALTGTARQRLDKLMPLLLQALQHVTHPAESLQRLLRLLQAIARRSVYLALLIEYPLALEQLVRLCAASPWISNLLTRYPVLLDELLDAQSLYAVPDRQHMTDELNHFLQPVLDDEERLLDNLRKFKQAQMLRVAAMDQAAELEVFAVSDQLTLLAEVLLEKVYQLAWQYMIERHGRPQCEINSKIHYPTMAVVAYGKLGGRELGYGSDLDVVFLHDSQGEAQQTAGANAVPNPVFFARLAQRMMHLMATQTGSGRLYEVDIQLRPDGLSGMLVSSFEAYEHYQQSQAWTWEHQALTRARLVVGAAQLATEFARIRRSVLARQRDLSQLTTDVLAMRQKMRDQLATKPTGVGQPEVFNLKQDVGGMVDIEFITQYGILANAAEQPALLDDTATRKMLRGLQANGWLSAAQADILYSAYAHYRQRSHQRALQEQTSAVDGKEFSDLRIQVQQIWQQVFNI